MDLHGPPWTSMDLHGPPWSSVEPHGMPWNVPRSSMDLHGISMELHGTMVSMEYSTETMEISMACHGKCHGNCHGSFHGLPRHISTLFRGKMRIMFLVKSSREPMLMTSRRRSLTLSRRSVTMRVYRKAQQQSIVVGSPHLATSSFYLSAGRKVCVLRHKQEELLLLLSSCSLGSIRLQASSRASMKSPTPPCPDQLVMMLVAGSACHPTLRASS